MTTTDHGLPTRRLFGLDFIDAVSVEPVVAELARYRPAHPGDDRLPVVVTPNVDQLVKLDRDADAVAVGVVGRAAWVLPDGQPIVWASRLLGVPLRGRLPGSTLVDRLWPALIGSGNSVLVIASTEELATRIDAEGPHARAVVAPQLSVSDRPGLDAFVDQCTAEIRRHSPSHVLVALGFPIQSHLIDGMLSRLTATATPPPMFLTVGAAFEMHYGFVRRAPAWMQRWGLEWLFRFIQEPRRLFRRYFVEDPAFLGLVRRELRERRGGSVRGQSPRVR